MMGAPPLTGVRRQSDGSVRNPRTVANQVEYIPMTLLASRAWKSADTLLSAVEKYSPAELWNRYVELWAVSQESSWPSYFVTPSLPDGTTPNSDSPLGALREQQNLRRELTSAIIRMLSDKQLIGVGYLTPKHRGDQPAWIPSKYWKTAQIGWNLSELRFADVAYQDVRVLHSRDFRDGARRKSRNTNRADAPLEKGRPSRTSQIIAAWDALVEEEKIPQTGTLNHLFTRVRAKVHRLYPNDNTDDEGLGDKLLYQVLSPRYKAYRISRRNLP